MRLDATFQPGQHVVARMVGDELVLLDYKGEVYYGLDAVGSRIWELLAGGATIAAVIDTLAEEYAVAREDLQRDVERLIGELQQCGLLLENP